jgi:hypothetical protein
MSNEAELQGNVRRFLEGTFSPAALAFMDGLVARIEDAIDNPRPVPEGEDPPQQDMMVALREFLESQLDDAQMQMLDQLISEVDSGEQDEDARQDYVEATQARQGGGAGTSQEETGNMNTHAMDEMRDLRRRLRAAGCPVGDRPDLGALRHLARTYLRPGMAMDSRARSLSLQSMFPTIAARFAKAGPGSFAVYPDRERQRAAASDRALAFDSRPSDDPRLSIERMFPRLGHLWNRAG